MGLRALSSSLPERYAVSMRKITCLLACFMLAANMAWAQNGKWLQSTLRAAEKEAASASSAARSAARAITAAEEEFVPSVTRHVNRIQVKPPLPKFRPDGDELDLWVKLKPKHLAGSTPSSRGINKSRLIDKIVQRHHNMNSALIDLFRLETKYGAQDFFHLFSAAYYRKVFGPLAPSFYDALRNISLRGDKHIQTLATARMQFLFSHKNRFMSIVEEQPDGTKGNWRLQWLPILNIANPKQFNPKRIVLSYERTMQPSRSDVTMDHISPSSYARINGTNTRILYFQEDLSYLPQLYKILLYKKYTGQPLFVAVDKINRVMFVFNEHKTKWIRISQHEFANPKNLHLHINRLKQIHFKTAKDQMHIDHMIINVTLPLKSREDLTPEELEDIFFNQTLKTLAKMPNVYIAYQSVY